MLLVSIVAGYLLGSIPVAWLVARTVTGYDLRRVGSGNVGVLNTAISVARWAGHPAPAEAAPTKKAKGKKTAAEEPAAEERPKKKAAKKKTEE